MAGTNSLFERLGITEARAKDLQGVIDTVTGPGVTGAEALEALVDTEGLTGQERVYLAFVLGAACQIQQQTDPLERLMAILMKGHP